MHIFSIFSAFFLLLSSISHAQKQVKLSLKDDVKFAEGMSAMKDHLPVIAAKHFITIINDKAKTFNKKDRLQLLLLLLEAQVRSHKPNEALKTLTDPLIATHPDAYFWKGQALASAGRYQDAVVALKQAKPESQHYKLAQIKIAYLAAAFGDKDTALSILNKAVEKAKQPSVITQEIYLAIANLYLSKNNADNATQALEKVTIKEGSLSWAKDITTAHLHILNKNYSEAIKILKKLLQNKTLIDSNSLSRATLHLADAQVMSGQKQAAIDTLMNYLNDNASSPMMGSIFAKLDELIPSDAAITDPTIKKFIAWAKRDTTNTNENNALNELNIEDQDQDRRAFAHYYYARFLTAKNDAACRAKAIFEFNLLRLRYPTHILAGTSLTDTATTQLALSKVDAARDSLKAIQKLNIPILPIAKQQAAFLLGKLELEEKDYAAAAKAFQNVVDSSQKQTQLYQAAVTNAASAYLSSANAAGYEKLRLSLNDEEVQENLLLEYALWLANKNKPEARAILHLFSQNYPNHPRSSEIKIALAQHCLKAAPIDIDLCQTLISEISKQELKGDLYADYTHLLYKNAAAHSDYAGASETARNFIKEFPNHPRLIEFTLLLGQALYHNGQHNDARQLLLSLAANHSQHPLKIFAEYYAAMSAKLEGTPQSEKEAISLFEKLTKEPSSLKFEALYQLSKLYIDKNTPLRAIKVLQTAYDAQAKKPLRLGIQLAKAHHAQGQYDPNSFQSAIDIYQTLSDQAQDDLKTQNQIKYHQALTLQHMGKDEDALSVYYSVINSDTAKTSPVGWNWYYKCGFNAITILEEMKNPKGAIQIAKKLAASGGNRAEESNKRIRDLEKKYMIWER